MISQTYDAKTLEIFNNDGVFLGQAKNKLEAAENLLALLVRQQSVRELDS
jgi:hypothetical protein